MAEKKNVGKKYEYYLIDKLGSGAFAEVFKGKNKETEETVAIKVIKRSLLAKYGEEILEQVHREVSILQDLVIASKQNACPFINRIYECLETQNNIYIVLEFCNQGTLEDQIKKSKKIEEKEAVFILFQILQALTLLSNNNIAHRDIKPENVFIKDGVYKLGDFGFAGQKSMYQTHLGTFPYMAPEFFISDQYDSKVDVWALGLLTHQMLFGEIYYIGRSQFEVQQKILTKPYILSDPKYQISEQLKNLLSKMICKDCKHRIAAQDALQDELFDWCRKDQRYLNMMEKEKQFMAQFTGNSSLQSEQEIQIQEEERQRKEEEERQRLFQEQLKQEKMIKIQEGILKLKEGIKDKMSGIILLVQLTDYLSQNVIEICRYEILYILKQATILITKLKESLEQKNILGRFEHLLFDVDQETWNYFYEDNSLQQLLEEIEANRNHIRRRYIEYLNYINDFTSKHYPESSHYTEQITNLNLVKVLDHQLYNEQLYQKIRFFKEDREKAKNPEMKSQMNKCLLWLYAAYEYQKLCSGQLMNIAKFMEAIERNDVQSMKACINWP